MLITMSKMIMLTIFLINAIIIITFIIMMMMKKDQ